MRRQHRAGGLALSAAGAALVLAAVVVLRESPVLQIALVLLGLVLIGAGTWGLRRPVPPSERKYVALRSEVDGFITLVRRLNKASLALTSDPSTQNRARLLEVRDEMLESVKRMEDVAGRTGNEADPAVPPLRRTR